MSQKKNGVNYSRSGKVTQRRKRALSRLQDQLEDGVKTKSLAAGTSPLTDADVKRIEREIENLKRKINSSIHE